MLQQPFALSPEEHLSIATKLESSKEIITQITSCLKKRLPFDQQIVVRAGELEAAIQRLEWQLERELGTVAPHSLRSAVSGSTAEARRAGR
jgi:hypothetical protein